MVHIRINKFKSGRKGRGIPRGYTSRVKAKRITVVDLKPSPEFPNDESKGRNVVYTVLSFLGHAHIPLRSLALRTGVIYNGLL